MPRNKEANQKVKDGRREQILAAALELFARKGLVATRISDISAKTGISQGLIYHYYKSKEEVFNWLIRDAVEKMNTAALELEKLPLSAKEKIVLAVEQLLKGFDQKVETAYYYFLITQAALSEAFPQEARDFIFSQNNIKYGVINRIFIHGQKEGTVRSFDAAEMTTLFFSTINGLAMYKAINGANAKMPDKRIILNMFLNEF
ncbi:MAG TPA: TetR/AcrR family transcriptional regulator [Bacteroidales bacterium]|mgnify:CR=1 FL=1|nr:TetR/AcrR family transcriptional regulator [Bacteroidales bacterium]